MNHNAALTEEYFAIMDELDDDIEGRRKAYTYMKNSTAIVHEQVVACSFVPRLFDTASWDMFRHVSETTHAILCKVIQHYLDDPTYRGVFSFDRRLEDLILLPRGYDALLPFARIDVFLDEDTLACGFCEFNGDGSAGMNENREITHSIETSETYRRFTQRHSVEQCELFHSWVKEFIAIYNTYEHRVEHPRFAICDYLEYAVVDEFKVFCDFFAESGYECIVCDVRDLSFDGTTLFGNDGKPIDAIWRRSVTNDVLEYWDESQDLIEAVRHEAVALIGSFAGHLVHDKQIFDVLYHPQTKAFLSDEENSFIAAHVPQTFFLDSTHPHFDEILSRKDDWIIKPTDNYGAKDVYAGCFHSQAEWEEIVKRYADGAAGAPFLVQRYITPYKTFTLPPDTNIESTTDERLISGKTAYNNLSGLYLYNGTFQGVFSRLGPHPTISKQLQGITAATLHVLD